ncbi:hypothetical protein FSP39_002299 [Pinctada imbricata]|uniref:Coiled-coil domain-containing protein 130-like protein n=1 Tax=Pinctada imbricata TaxID=66713 RepID=A0AA88XPF8_PINIB|nr:hypothetical protein FSP39_002299 [Pinctada imbricata]
MPFSTKKLHEHKRYKMTVYPLNSQQIIETKYTMRISDNLSKYQLLRLIFIVRIFGEYVERRQDLRDLQGLISEEFEMAERKSQNKYYPPDWDPSKGSVNKYVGQHPLRDRAKKIKQGILVIRFEMPYNIWCGGCNSHIGMGVRYNAEKKKVGNYYTTPIWMFRMKCHLCDNYFEIQTDPKNHDYVILSGARRKEQRWDPKENEQIETEDKATQKKMATDAMFKLEHGSDDKKKGKTTVASLGEMEERRGQFKDDYLLNKLAREKFRNEKKALKVKETEDKDLLAKSSLDIPLVEESDEDIRLAGLLKYSSTESYDKKQLEKRKEIEARPLFDQGSGGSPTTKAELLRKQISTSKSKPSPFDNVHITSKTLALSNKLLGIRRRKENRSKLSKGKGQLDLIPEEKDSVMESEKCEFPNRSMTDSNLHINEVEQTCVKDAQSDHCASIEGMSVIDNKELQNNARLDDDVCDKSNNADSFNMCGESMEQKQEDIHVINNKPSENITTGLNLVSAYSDSESDMSSDG